MTKKHKIRLAFFIGTVLFMLICSADYAIEYRDLVRSDGFISDKPDHMYVDGADVAGIFNLFSSVVDSFILAFTNFFYGLFVLIGSIIFFLILRFAAIRKDSEVTETEYRISLRAMWISTAAIFIISVMMAGIGLFFYTLGLFWQIPLFAFLLYLLPLKKRIPDDDTDP